jgi:hypothetical protein
MQIRSGDDDLFVNQAASSKNTTICFTPEGFTYSKPKLKYAEWFTQKRRHVATAQFYKPFDKLQLGLFYLSQLLFIVLSILLLAFQFQWIIVLSIIGFRYLITWMVIGFGASKLKEKDVVYWYPIIELMLVVTQINVFITNIFSKPVHWK